jgi:fructose-1,6-bisphosphatase I
MRVQTLGQFIIEKQNDFPYAKGELSRLLRDIGIAAKIVNREVSKAGLAEILGETGEINVQGEQFVPLLQKRTKTLYLLKVRFLKALNM